MAGWEAIPGETPIDPSGLKDRGVRTREALIPLEAENIRKATVHYLAQRPTAATAPFTYEWMLEVHQRMFGDVWEWAGVVRLRNLSLGIDYSLIGQQLGGLTLDITAWQLRDELFIEQSARIHHEAVRIHPFENGNGRWARMLANIWLLRGGVGVVEWPESEVGESESFIRGDYLKAIRLADQGDRRALEALHRQYLQSL